MQNLVKNNPDSAKAYIYLGTYWESMDKEEAKKASAKDAALGCDDFYAQMPLMEKFRPAGIWRRKLKKSELMSPDQAVTAYR